MGFKPLYETRNCKTQSSVKSTPSWPNGFKSVWVKQSKLFSAKIIFIDFVERRRIPMDIFQDIFLDNDNF